MNKLPDASRLWSSFKFGSLLACGLFFSLSIFSVVLAEEPAPRFAPGALGDLPALDLLHSQGEADGKRLPALPEADPDALGDLDIRAILERGRTMAPSTGLPMSEALAGELAPKPLILVFASLGMPDRAFKQLSRDADAAGALVILRGFIENSIPASYARLADIYDVDMEAAPLAAPQADIPPFVVDPRMFRLFDVAAVPMLVALDAPVPDCANRFCAGDPVPAHSRVSGNGVLTAALERVAHAGGPGAAASAAALSRLVSSLGGGE